MDSWLFFFFFFFFYLSFATGTDKFEMLTIWITLENCKKEKIKTANCTRISRLSLSFSRSKLDLSNLRIYKCGDFDFGYRAAHRFSTVSSVPEIVVHLDNYSSLPIPLPPSSTTNPPNEFVNQARNFDSKKSFDRLKDISVPIDSDQLFLPIDANPFRV